MAVRQLLRQHHESLTRHFIGRSLPFDGGMSSVVRVFSSLLQSESTLQLNAWKNLADILSQLVFATNDKTICSGDDLHFLIKVTPQDARSVTSHLIA